MSDQKHILITGGAGYIGSFLAGELLRAGFRVTTVDDLLYGGESMLAYLSSDRFRFVKSDVWESRAIKAAIGRQWQKPFAVVHLAGIAGFPACQSVGRHVAWRYNVETAQHVYQQCHDIGIERFLFISSYSNYGLPAGNGVADEETPLNPQSLYAETEVAVERFLIAHKHEQPASLVLRTASPYGLSPRPRFDLLINQFVFDAYTKRQLMLYQRGYYRSFIHIRDLVQGILLGLQAPLKAIAGKVYNIGSQDGNLSKDDIVSLILKRMPETIVNYKDLTFGGDMRDIKVSFMKIRKDLNYATKYTVDDGIREVLNAIRFNLIANPGDPRYRNARFIVQ